LFTFLPERQNPDGAGHWLSSPPGFCSWDQFSLMALLCQEISQSQSHSQSQVHSQAQAQSQAQSQSQSQS
jgi:hypothetical protein